MAVTRYAGDRFVIGGSDNEPTGVLDGAYLINTGTLSQKVLRNGTWATLAGGGGGSTNPAAPLNSVQFNDSSSFGGSANLTFTDGNRLNVNKLGISGNIYDSNNSLGEGGMVLTNEGQTGVNWKSIESVLSGVGGSGVQNYVARWADEDTLTSGTIYDDGDVGIGTANPGGKLHVFDTTVADMVILESTNPSAFDAPDLIFYRNSSSPADLDDLGILKFRGRNEPTGGGGVSDINYAQIESQAISVTDGVEGGALNFYTYENGSSAKRVTITGSNLGIGTASPYRKLHVNGDAIISGKFYDVTNSTGDKGYVLTSDDNGPVWAASGDFDTLSGNLVATGAIVDDISGNLITSGQTLTNNLIATGAIVDDVSGNLITTGQTLTTNINTVATNLIETGLVINGVSGNLITTGQTLTTNINTVSTNLIATGAVVDNISGNLIETGQYLTDEIAIVSGLATGGSAEDFAALSGALIATGAIVDDVSGNLITTGQTLTTNINTVSTNLVATGAILDDISGNLITTGQTLTTNINTVSTNLIATGAVVDDISGNLVQTGQYLTDEIAIVSGLVSTGAIDGSGVTNYVAKWSDQDTLTSGIIYDNATKVGISTASPQAELHIYAGDVAGDHLLVESTNAAAGDAPDLVLYRNSPSPANSDDLGIIRFRGKNNGTDTGYGENKVIYADIEAEITSVVSGSEGAALKFYTQDNGSFASRMVITGANVGIGTNDPEAPLTVAGPMGNQVVFRTDQSTASQRAGGGFSSLGHATATSRYARLFLDADGANFGSVDYFTIEKFGNSGEVKLLQYSNANMSFWVNTSTQAMTIKNDGNVGIGTATPTEKLTIFGGVASPATSGTGANGNLAIESSNGNSLYFGSYSASPYACWLQVSNYADQSLTYPLILQPNGGNVGIGTNDPAARLYVLENAANWAAIIKNSNAGGYGLSIDCTANTGTTVYALAVYTGVGTGLFVRNTGNVGIGTAQPVYALDIYKSVTGDWLSRLHNTATSGNSSGLLVRMDEPGSTGFAFAALVNGNYKLAVKPDGKVGIGEAAPDAILEIANNDNSSYRFGYGGTSDVYLDADDVYFRSDSGATNHVTKKGTLVGIGTASPVYNLQGNGLNGGIIGVTRTSGSTNGTLGHVRFGNTDIDSDLANIKGIQDGATDSARLQFETHPTSGSATARMTIKSDGKVGIGTTDPAAQLDLRSSDSVVAYVIRPSASPTVHIGSATSAGAQLGYVHAHDYAFYGHDAAYNAIVVKSDGDVGIGTTDPNTLLHLEDDTATAGLTLQGAGPGYVNAAIVLKATNGTSVRGLGVFMHDAGGDTEWYAGTPYAAADNYVIARKASQASPDYGTAIMANALFTIDNNGNVGLGITDPAHNLHVSGDAIISGYLYDSTNSTGDKGYVLTSDDNGPLWKASGDFDGLSGNLVATGAIVDDISGNLFTTGDTLQAQITANDGDISTLTTNLITTGQTLTSEIAIVSGLATGGSAEDFAALSGALIATGAIVDDVSGNLFTTGDTLQAQITANDGDISTLTTNLITTGQTLQTQITSNDSDISTLTSNLITTGQTLQAQITSNDADITTLTSNLITTGETLQTQITANDGDISTLTTNLITTGQTLTSEIGIVSGLTVTNANSLVSTGAVVDDISGNLITTGQTLTSEIAIVSGLVSTGALDGSGVANYSAKWLDGNTVTSGVIYDNGDVGIGTANPDAKLHVLDTVAGDVVILETTHPSSSNGPDIVFYRNSSSPADADELGRLAFRGKNDADQDINYTNIIAEAIDVSDGTEDGALKFYTYLTGASTETMVLRSANVGIGTNAPDAHLHIEKSLGATTVLTEVAANSTVGYEIKKTGNTTQHWKIVDGQTANGYLEIYDATDSATRMAFNTAGNVGIGIVNAGQLLTIKGDSKYFGAYASDGSLSVLLGTDANGDGQLLLADVNGTTKVLLEAEASAPSYINNGGSVGIGTDAPSARLFIKGDSTSRAFQAVGSSTTAGVGYFYTNEIHTGTTTNATVSIRSDHASSNGQVLHVRGDGSGDLLTLDQGGISRVVVKANGNVGIGTDAPAAKLEVADGAVLVKNDLGGATDHSELNIFKDTGDNSSAAILRVGYDAANSYMIQRQRASGSIILDSQQSGSQVYHQINGDTIFTVDSSNVLFYKSAEFDAGIKDKDGSFGTNGYVLTTDGVGDVTWAASPGSGSVDGSGTANYVSKWTDSDTIGNSSIFDNGDVGIGTNAPSSKLHVNSEISCGADDNNRAMFGYTPSRFYLGTRQSGTNYLNTVSVTSGNVGIGTVTPEAELHAHGTTLTGRTTGTTGAYVLNSYDLVLSNGNSGTVILLYNNSGAFHSGLIKYDTNCLKLGLNSSNSTNAISTATAVNIGSVGVGIGTDDPGSKLEVYAASGLVASHVKSGTVISRLTANSTASDGVVGTSSAHDFLIQRAGSTRMTFSGSSVVVNDSGEDIDFRVEGDTDANLIRTDAANDRVGIGTNAPLAKLMVGAGTRNAGAAVQNQTAYFSGTKSAFADPAYKGLWQGQLHIADDSALAAGIGGAITFGATQDNTNGTFLASIEGSRDNATSGQYGASMIFRTRTNGSAVMGAHMVINSVGNVGIGTDAPGGKLESYITSGGEKGLRLNSNFAGGNTVDFIPAIVGVSNAGFSIDLAGSTKVVIGSTGLVGIGTNNPAYILDVYETTSNIAIFRSTATNYARVIIRAGASGDAQLSFQESTTTKWTIGNDGGDSDKFKIVVGGGAFGTSPIVAIDTAGKVGVGSNAPAFNLDVTGTGHYTGLLNLNAGLYLARESDSLYGTYIKGGSQQFPASPAAYYSLGKYVMNTASYSYDTLTGHVVVGYGNPNTNDSFAKITFTVYFRDNNSLATGAPYVTWTYNVEGKFTFQSDPPFRVSKTQDVSGGAKTYELQFSVGANYGTAHWKVCYSNVSTTNAVTIYDYAATIGTAISDGRVTRQGYQIYPGCVGIGTDAPTSPLTIKSSSTSATDSGLTIQGNSNTNAIVKIAEKSTDGARLHLYDGGVEKIAFYTDGTANHISAGSVGIGTNNPSNRLHIEGTTLSNASIRIEKTTTGINEDPGLVLAAANNTDGYRIGSIFFQGGATSYAQIRAEMNGTAGAKIYFVAGSQTNPVSNSSTKTLELEDGTITAAAAFRPLTDSSYTLGQASLKWSELYVDKIKDVNNSTGSANQVLSAGGSGGSLDWISLSEISGVDGSGTANTIPRWTDSDTIGDSIITVPSNISVQVAGPLTATGNITVGPSNNSKIYMGGNDYIAFTDGVGDGFKFVYDNSEKVRITNVGNVGIGTVTPQGKLDINTEAAEATHVYINGEVNQDKLLYFRHYANSEGAGATGYVGYIGSKGNDNLLSLGHLNSSGTDVPIMHLAEDGHVGIGTTDPAYILDVYETGSNLGIFRSTATTYARLLIRSGSTGDAQLAFQNNTSTKWSIGNDGGDSDKFKIAVGAGAFSTSEAVTISTSGCVGIGTNAPLEPLHVYDAGDWQIRMSSGGARAGLVIDKPGTTTTMGSALVVAADETYRLGTASYYHVVMQQGGTVSLQYQGSTRLNTTSGGVTVTGTLTETSSITLKENVETYTPSLDIINKIRPVKYNRKTNKDKKEIGLIAEELAELFPELVEKDEKGNPSSVNYSRAVTVLLGGFKELYKEIEELKKRI